MHYPTGDPVHMEVVSTDAHSGVKFDLYPSGSTTARSTQGVQLLPTEVIWVTDIIFISTAGGTYTINMGAAAGAGTRIAKGNAAALGGLAHHFETPIALPKGTYPYLIAAAGQVDCVLTGFVVPQSGL